MKTTFANLLAIFTMTVSVVSANQWQNDLNYNQQYWQRQNIVHYNYQYTEISGPNPADVPNPWHIEVRNSIGVHVEDGAGRHISWTKPPTMEDFFNRVQTEINGNPRAMSVVYSSLGFPASIYVLRANGEVYDVSLHNFVSANSLQAELDTFQDVWARQNIQNYNYHYTERSGPNPENVPSPWRIEVRNNAGVHVEDGNGSPIGWTRPPRMEDFFHRVQTELNGGPRRIDVTYSPWGFPSEIYVVRKDNTVYDVSLHNFVYGTQLPTRRLADDTQGTIDSKRKGLRGSAI